LQILFSCKQDVVAPTPTVIFSCRLATEIRQTARAQTALR